MDPFAHRDPLSPQFWDERFARGFTPWDRGGVPEALRAFVAGATPGTALIPGCGSAHELGLLCEAGWDATAIDFSPVAVAAARSGKWGARVLEADFFAWEPARPLDLIYERAFLCALPRSMWPRVAARWAQLLAPGALLAGFFYLDEGVKGPPFGIGARELAQLLEAEFRCIEDAAVTDSMPVFAGKERWRIYQRRPLDR